MPNMSFLMTAYVNTIPSNKAATTTAVGIKGGSKINRVVLKASMAGLNMLVSRVGDSPSIVIIQKRMSEVVTCMVVLPMKPTRTARTSPVRLEFSRTTILFRERVSATVATMAPMSGMNRSTRVSGPSSTLDIVNG